MNFYRYKFELTFIHLCITRTRTRTHTRNIIIFISFFRSPHFHFHLGCFIVARKKKTLKTIYIPIYIFCANTEHVTLSLTKLCLGLGVRINTIHFLFFNQRRKKKMKNERKKKCVSCARLCIPKSLSSSDRRSHCLLLCFHCTHIRNYFSPNEIWIERIECVASTTK